MKNNTMRLIAAFFAGASAGAIFAYLTAPQSGKETRNQISDEAHRLVNSIESEIGQRIEGLKKEYESKIDKLAANSHKLFDKGKEVVKPE